MHDSSTLGHAAAADNNNTSGHPKMDTMVSPAPSGGEQQYSLKWNDFQSSIMSSFRHLRDEEDFVDVTLACDLRSFRAHKVVLSACSPYFRKLLKANPCEHPIVILRDIRSEDVESLLRFMYNGEVNIGQEQLTDFLKTAHLLQVRGLADVSNPNRLSNSLINSCITPLSASAAAAAASSNVGAATTVQELKASPTSTSLPWDLADDSSQPPPQKRTKSSELYRRQHGLSPERTIRELASLTQHPLTRERHRDRDRDNKEANDRERRDRSLELRESLLGQALEGGPTLIVPTQKHQDLASLQAQSTGEDSNASDNDASDRDEPLDGSMDGLNGSLEHGRSSFPSAFLGLQGIPGLLPGTSAMHAENFVSRRALEMRVRATDPRPCPKCGKIYRSAHTLRTHLEDKHTVCPGYRCVLCGTVAKSRNSLHSHMSRQHRGISTKDLPVLPMPSPFDPELASKLLAKAGVKISPAELRARASPTGTRRSDMKLELRSGDDPDMDDPEDLTMSHIGHNNNGGGMRYHESLMGLSPTGFNHPNTTITRVRPGAITPKSIDSMGKESHGNHMSSSPAATGSAILDTYLQFITENTFGMQMTQEQAAAAIHAAKMAQLNAMGHNLDKLPPGFLPPHLDIAKINNNQQNNRDDISLSKLQSTPSVTIEPTSNNNQSSLHQKLQQQFQQSHLQSYHSNVDIRRESSEPMDLGLDNAQNNSHNNDDGNSSGDERGYASDDEGVTAN